MALTKLEKDLLDKILLEDDEVFPKETPCSIYDVARTIVKKYPQLPLNIDYCTSSLLASVNRLVDKNLCIIISDSVYNFQIMTQLTGKVILKQLDFTKEKNILYLNAEKTAYYDFISNTLYPTKGNLYFTQSYIKDSVKWLLEYGQIYEWLFNYISTTEFPYLRNYISVCPELLKKMPIAFNTNDIQANYRLLPNHSLIENIVGMAILQILPKEAGYYLHAKDFAINKYHIVLSIISAYPNFYKDLQKICANSAKLFELDWESLDQICKYALKLIEGKIIFTLDTNRTLAQNKTTLKSLWYNAQNNLLNVQLKKLNFINGLRSADGLFEVVVPQTQVDKVNEGQQQNNCVGYHYDSSIINGDNFIYFIRKTTSPTKSYITCRFNVGRRRTTEYKLKNNNPVPLDCKALSFITTIDEIVNQNIDKLK